MWMSARLRFHFTPQGSWPLISILIAKVSKMPGPGDRKQSVGASGSRRKASQSNTTPSNVTSPELGSKSQSTDGYVPVNSFNSQEVVSHFDRTWKAALESYHQPGPSNVVKPELYKGSEAMAWGNKVAPKGAMSTGVDFLTELQRKQSSA